MTSEFHQIRYVKIWWYVKLESFDISGFHGKLEMNFLKENILLIIKKDNNNYGFN